MRFEVWYFTRFGEYVGSHPTPFATRTEAIAQRNVEPPAMNARVVDWRDDQTTLDAFHIVASRRP